MEPTQERVLVHEPHHGEPAATDSLELEIVSKQRNRLINSMVVYVVGGGLVAALDPGPSSAGFAAILAAVTVLQLWLLFFRVLPCRKLLAYPAVLLTPGPSRAGWSFGCPPRSGSCWPGCGASTSSAPTRAAACWSGCPAG
ncbi:hypothetical protein [Amycolatopsis thermoflava]|uniref:hypothetical protein n=1 Tax=Amycolatopsis thermoflava TaxID=84480 RepID=UPI00382DFFC3